MYIYLGQDVEEHIDEAPIGEDKFGSIKMVEYKDVVVFYFDKIVDDRVYVPNIIMTKAQNGLIYDGNFNVKIEQRKEGFLGLGASYFYPRESDLLETSHPVKLTDMNLGANFVNLDHEVAACDGYNWPGSGVTLPRYYSITRPPEPNAICAKNFWTSFVGSTWWPYGKGYNEIAKTAEDIMYSIRANYFQVFGDISMLISEDSPNKSMNSCFNSIYNAISKIDSSTTINVTDLFYHAQKVSDKYELLNSQCFLNVEYVNHKNQNAFKTDSVNEDGKNITDTTILEEVKDLTTATKLTIKLVNKNNTSLKGFDISKSPVTIKLTNSNNTYTFLFDTMTKLNTSVIKGVQPGDYDVEIISNVLDCGNASKITVKNTALTVELPYTYTAGVVNVSVKLMPLSNFSDFIGDSIMSNSPVNVCFYNSNGVGSYDFIFDSLSDLNSSVSRNLPIGQYSYTIYSSYLVFTPTTGTVTVDVNHTNFVFDYDTQTHLEFDIQYKNSHSGDTSALGSIRIYESDYDFSAVGGGVKQATLLIYKNDVQSSYVMTIGYSATSNPVMFFQYITDTDIECDSFQLVIQFEDNTSVVTNMYMTPITISSSVVQTFDIVVK